MENSSYRKPFGIVTNIAVEFYQVAYRTCSPNQSQPILIPGRHPMPGTGAGAALVPVDACSWLGQWDGSWLLDPAWLPTWGAAIVPDTPSCETHWCQTRATFVV